MEVSSRYCCIEAYLNFTVKGKCLHWLESAISLWHLNDEFQETGKMGSDGTTQKIFCNFEVRYISGFEGKVHRKSFAKRRLNDLGEEEFKLAGCHIVFGYIIDILVLEGKGHHVKFEESIGCRVENILG